MDFSKYLAAILLLLLPLAGISAQECAASDAEADATETVEESDEEGGLEISTEIKSGDKHSQTDFYLSPADIAPTFAAPKYQFFKSVPVEKPYKFMDDMTFVGIPLFAAGMIIKSKKTEFRQNYTDDHIKKKTVLLTNFKTSVDDYMQFAPLVLATGLKLGGVDGRSDWLRYIVSAGMSYAIMAAIVNPIKYAAKEMRPDGSSANSFPSGHTATAFVGATILHKEYGLTHSPWYSAAGYAVATATGILRVLNNRHWVSDVLAGAGIGIFSTELAYGLSDIIFKGKGLRRTDLENMANIVQHPSFFAINMGVGIGNKNLVFALPDEEGGPGEQVAFRFKPSTVVSAEGAYFFNKYIGVGGRFALRTTPVEGFGDLMDYVAATVYEFNEDFKKDYKISPIDFDKSDLTIESDHFTEFTGMAGVYLNLPLSKRFALGTKLLIGRSAVTDILVSATMAGNTVRPSIDTESGKPTYIAGDPYSTRWDMLNVKGSNGMTYGSGLSVTFAYKSTFSWRAFIDYDYVSKTYTFTSDALRFFADMAPEIYSHDDPDLAATQAVTTKSLHHFTFGGAFCISF